MSPPIIIAAIILPLSAAVLCAQLPESETLSIPPHLAMTGYHEEPPTMLIEERDVIDLFPILPIIFFDHPGDATIPARYRLFASFAETSAFIDTATVYGWMADYVKYYELPNIVGGRMRRAAEMTIRLEGGYSGEAGESASVATRRAEAVRDYLTDVWSIAPERIVIGEPQRLCDPADHLMRQEEARCVRIETESPELLRPVRHRTVELKTRPLLVDGRITPNIPPERVASIELLLRAAGEIVGSTTIRLDTGATSHGFEARWDYLAHDIHPRLFPLSFEAVIITVDGERLVSNGVPVGNSQPDVTPEDVGLGYFRLPFFPYRDSILSLHQKSMIAEQIAALGSPDRLRVSIYGWGVWEGAEGSEDFTADPDALSATQRNALIEEEERVLWEKRKRAEGALLGSLLSIRSRRPLANASTITLEMDGTLRVDGAARPPADPSLDPLEEYERYRFQMMDGASRIDPLVYRHMIDLRKIVREASPYPLDSLARARARMTLSYIGDTLGIAIVDRANEAELIDGLDRHYGSFTPFHTYLLPEERWYARGFILSLEIVEKEHEPEGDVMRRPIDSDE